VDGELRERRTVERRRTHLAESRSIFKADGTKLDAGVSDKRAFLVEEEFAGTLKVASREGNNLSAVLRKAWDGDTLAALTKNSPARATNPHIPWSATRRPRS
jgi:hypothetical protein